MAPIPLSHLEKQFVKAVMCAPWFLTHATPKSLI